VPVNQTTVSFTQRRPAAFSLWDAITRSLRSEVAVFALAVDAKDGQVEAFHLHHGFVAFGSQPRQLVLPLGKLSGGALAVNGCVCACLGSVIERVSLAA
jgi:hypothetical protein